MLCKKFSLGPVSTNTYLVGCLETKKGAVIDPAMGSLEVVQQAAQEAGITLEKILLTHSHWDHFVDAAALQKATHSLVYVHPLDLKNLENPGSDKLPCPLPIAKVHPDRFVEDKMEIALGTLLFQVLHTPGHTPGGVCYYLPSHNLLFSGDTLFRGSIGNLHFPTGEPEKMWTSLAQIHKLPPVTRVLPGHGPDTLLEKEPWLDKAQELFGDGL